MFEDIFFAIAYGIMGLVQDKRYGCLTVIIVIIVILIVVGKIFY